jgi:outer membrane protein OmpA-like peptidoglycan-associated protein
MAPHVSAAHWPAQSWQHGGRNMRLVNIMSTFDITPSASLPVAQTVATPSRRLALSGAALWALAGCATRDQPASIEIESPKRVRFEDTPEGARVVLDDSILFEFGKSEFAGPADTLLDLLRPVLARARGLIIIEGHTDSVGQAAFNLDLSKRRAERVREELIKRQVAPERIVARALGASKPRRTPELTEADRRMNRRAELLFPGETVASLDGVAVTERADSSLARLGKLLGERPDAPAAAAGAGPGAAGAAKAPAAAASGPAVAPTGPTPVSPRP